jgi:hypothetical protein
MALMAFSLINDSSNLFKRGSNSSDVLILARSGSVRILCSTVATISDSFQIVQSK